VAPGGAVDTQEERFDGLLRALLGSETRPFVVATVQGLPGVIQISLRLAKPIFVSRGHACAPVCSEKSLPDRLEIEGMLMPASCEIPAGQWTTGADIGR
jgi:hypothetical protein